MADHHTLFITASYGLSVAGLVVLAVKSFVDMRRSEEQARNLRRLRRSEGEA